MYALFNLLWFYASALKFLSLSAFERTDTELKLIAAEVLRKLKSALMIIKLLKLLPKKNLK